MKVLFVASYGGFYGANKSLLELIKILTKKYNINPVVLIPNSGQFEKELKINNINYIKMPYVRWMIKEKKDIKELFIFCYYFIINRIIILFIINKLKKYDIDLIHSNSSVTDIGAEISKKLNVKHIWHFREFGKQDYSLNFIRNKKEVINKINNYSDHVIFISHSLKEHYSYMNIKNSSVIYNGINEFPYLKNHENKDDNFFKIVITGLVSENKNQLELIKSVQILVNTYKIKNIRVYILGKSQKSYLYKIKKFINQNNLNKYIYLIGHTDEVPDYLSRCDLAVITSKKEAFGRVTIEYMLSNLPVIASKSGANKELIDNFKTGIFYELGSIKDLSEKIKLLYDDNNLAKEISSNAKDIALKKYTSSVNAKKIFNLYKKILRI